MPLACVLEGGTWAAGRATGQRLRGGDCRRWPSPATAPFSDNPIAEPTRLDFEEPP
jgi:hypothetical protein